MYGVESLWPRTQDTRTRFLFLPLAVFPYGGTTGERRTVPRYGNLFFVLSTQYARRHIIHTFSTCIISRKIHTQIGFIHLYGSTLQICTTRGRHARHNSAAFTPQHVFRDVEWFTHETSAFSDSMVDFNLYTKHYHDARTEHRSRPPPSATPMSAKG